LDWYTGVLEIIDTRSFTSIWYWIIVAVIWSTTAHYTLGVPYDMVTRARRHETGPAQDDLEGLVAINCNRLINIVEVSGIWLVAFGFFVLTMLALLGFVYRVELAQALFFLGAPLSLVAILTVHNARLLRADQTDGAALRNHLARQRFFNQLIGLLAIVLTAFWGMWHNLNASVL